MFLVCGQVSVGFSGEMCSDLWLTKVGILTSGKQSPKFVLDWAFFQLDKKISSP